jgi:hypothetical protein
MKAGSIAEPERDRQISADVNNKHRIRLILFGQCRSPGTETAPRGSVADVGVRLAAADGTPQPPGAHD